MRVVLVALALLVFPAGVGTALAAAGGAGFRADPGADGADRAHARVPGEPRARAGISAGRGGARGGAARSHREGCLDRGLVARRDVEALDALAQAARARVDETRLHGRGRCADGRDARGDRGGEDASRRAGEVVSTSTVIRYQGGMVEFAAGNVAGIETFFAGQFGRSLPVSALGQTPVHDRLGLDHRHALDVALHPDSDAGKALIAYLRRERIPFLAFKGPVPDASTGAHIHIGQVSPRLIPAKAAGR